MMRSLGGTAALIALLACDSGRGQGGAIGPKAAMPPPATSAVAAPATEAATSRSGGDEKGRMHVSGKNFALEIAAADCKAASECAMTIKLVAGAGYHVNKEYPYKFVAAPSPNLTFLGKDEPNTFTRAAGDFVEDGEATATMTVRFKPASAGDARVGGKYKLSVCSASKCEIEEQPVELAVPVM